MLRIPFRTASSLPSSSKTILPSPATRRHISLPSLSSLFRRKPASDSEPTVDSSPKSIFDQALDSPEVSSVVAKVEKSLQKPATFHKSSTANFKSSQRKLNDLARLIAGKGVDEGVLQLQVSPKKQALRLLSMLTLARDHAIAKGLSRSKLVIAQSWTTQGPSLPRLDIKGRGRHGVKHHPSSKLHVLLAEGRTSEEKKRERKMEQWRLSVRGVAEGGAGVGVGKGRKAINVGVGQWKW